MIVIKSNDIIHLLKKLLFLIQKLESTFSKFLLKIFHPNLHFDVSSNASFVSAQVR